jgi:hypothetical protein
VALIAFFTLLCAGTLQYKILSSSLLISAKARSVRDKSFNYGMHHSLHVAWIAFLDTPDWKV